MAPLEPHEPHEATAHFDVYGVSGESCSTTRATCRKAVDDELGGKLGWPLFLYIVGGIVFIGLIIGGYFIARTEAANDKCGSLDGRMCRSETDRDGIRAMLARMDERQEKMMTLLMERDREKK